MGCTSSAPATVDPRSAAGGKCDPSIEDGFGSGAKASKDAGASHSPADPADPADPAERTERVLPASDTVETNVDVDSTNESAATATENDILIFDIESEPPPAPPPPAEDIMNGIHSREAPTEESSGTPLPPPAPAAEAALKDLEQEGAVGPEPTAADTGQDTNGAEHNGATLETAAGELAAGDEEAGEEEAAGWSLERRSTRWEALADVAAELPPKLTVDPTTGQIYALSKRD